VGHPRVHFEALVAMGEARGGGFEAESVDVSPEGMRLRTAYLPEVGQRLVCRFDGDGGEIVAEGEVLWRKEQARGGDFGLRFVSFDSEDAEAKLRAMCQELGGDEEEGKGASAVAIPGTRVRLHIEGLGSPMKARVRESQGGDLLVGSNLEFLKVGRPLELEDMDHGDKRPATIDGVKVEVDPGSRVPQLVVSLRFEGAKEEGEKKKETAPSAARRPVAPALELKQKVESEAPTPVAAPSRKEPRSAAPATRPSASEKAVEATAARTEEQDEEARDPSLDAPAVGEKERKDLGATLRGASEKAAGATKAAFAKIGPAFGKLGSSAKDAFSGIVGRVRKRREEDGTATAEGAPRRMTAPPPTGALKSAGRKLMRDQGESEEGAATAAAPAKSNRKAALAGSALGLCAVLLVVGGLRLFTGAKAPEGQGPEGAGSAAAAALPAPEGQGTAAPVASGAPVDPNATPTANVPLFGATPLSTTEPVPTAPAPEGSAAAALAAPGQPAPAGDGAQAGDTQPAAMPSLEADDSSDDGAEPAPTSDGKKFGKGSVHNPIVLKIKTDGPIENVSGAAGAMGFTVSLPGRRALSSATELARKDKRIASINVVNNPSGAEISIQFKDGVPAYMAKAKGDRLDIALGTEGKKKVAKAGGKKKPGHDGSKKKPGKKKPGHH
jgi:hypothetical protein